MFLQAYNSAVKSSGVGRVRSISEMPVAEEYYIFMVILFKGI